MRRLTKRLIPPLARTRTRCGTMSPATQLPDEILLTIFEMVIGDPTGDTCGRWLGGELCQVVLNWSACDMPQLITLRLHSCYTKYQWLTAVLHSARSLKQLELHDVEFRVSSIPFVSSVPFGVDSENSLEQVLDAGAFLSVHSLSIHPSLPDMSEFLFVPRVFTFMPTLENLRILKLSRINIPDLSHTAPNLETIVIHSTEYTSPWRAQIVQDRLEFAGEIKRAAQSWLFDSPRMRKIVLCPYAAARAQADLEVLSIASFLLGGFLARLAVELVVDVTFYS
ncbi:hypothetical protein EXIGLDRAFT_722932 [Exidia glandulosa HHB12029]|uniref:F-box domain-containing protein n=1 Tax=Exidia glandulosa HHB12029 TaxID=1314781 RepID=A0A165F165_EXIGL|nr:hypothetical protein EXIGLDRAFT_722932 [Exidia glandulosa HHB12029]